MRRRHASFATLEMVVLRVWPTMSSASTGCNAKDDWGFYHIECADVGDDDDGDEWVCRLCLSMPGELPKYAVAMPTRFPPDGVPLYKCVDIWLDSADSMFDAIEWALGAVRFEQIGKIVRDETECVGRNRSR